MDLKSWQSSTPPPPGKTRTSLAITVRMRSSKPNSAFKVAAFSMGKTLKQLAFNSRGSLGESHRGSLNKEAAFTLSDTEPGPHDLTLTNFHGEVGCFGLDETFLLGHSLHFDIIFKIAWLIFPLPHFQPPVVPSNIEIYPGSSFWCTLDCDASKEAFW